MKTSQITFSPEHYSSLMLSIKNKLSELNMTLSEFNEINKCVTAKKTRWQLLDASGWRTQNRDALDAYTPTHLGIALKRIVRELNGGTKNPTVFAPAPVKTVKFAKEHYQALLKEQKSDILSQMMEVEEALWGDNKNKEEIRKLFLTGGIACPFEEADLDRVKKLGYKVNNKGQIIFSIKKTGTYKIHWNNIINVIDTVKKEFPEKVNKSVKCSIRTCPKPKRRVYEIAEQRGTLESNQVAFDIAKENLETAQKSGNKKQQELFSGQLNIEKEIFEYANVIYSEVEEMEMAENI